MPVIFFHRAKRVLGVPCTYWIRIEISNSRNWLARDTLNILQNSMYILRNGLVECSCEAHLLGYKHRINRWLIRAKWSRWQSRNSPRDASREKCNASRQEAAGFLIPSIDRETVTRSLLADSSWQTNLHATITRNYDGCVCTYARASPAYEVKRIISFADRARR